MFKKVYRKLLFFFDQYIASPKTVRMKGERRALLCYIVAPFRYSNSCHCNFYESQWIADVLESGGYAVDVVDYRSSRLIDYTRYDLVLGFGRPFVNSFYSSKKMRRILYLTGANPNFSNAAEARRIKNLYLRRGVSVCPRREVYWPWMYSAINADSIILTGNDWTMSTYSGIHSKISCVPVPFVGPASNYLNFYNKNPKSFLWFGGAGAVHKGLDLVLEVIAQYENDFTLDICGPILNEKDFFEIYGELCFQHPRIRFHGLIDPFGRSMKEIVERCSFVILPSCSEGMASSVVACMGQGLIPVITKQAGIDLPPGGIMIESDSLAAVFLAMKKASLYSKEEIARIAEDLCKDIQEKHSEYKIKGYFCKAITSD